MTLFTISTTIGLLFTLVAARIQLQNPHYRPGAVVPSYGKQNYAAPPNEQYCKLLAGTNKYRASFNRNPLVGDRRLDDAAAVHCKNMGNAGELEHNVYGSTPAQRVAQQGYNWNNVAENIYSEYGYGGSSPERAVEAWYNSAGHRTNMMGNYRSVGYAECIGRDGKNYYAQVFGNGDYNPHQSYDEVTCGYQPPRQEYRQEQQQPKYQETPSQHYQGDNHDNNEYKHQEEKPYVPEKPKYNHKQDYQKPTTEYRQSSPAPSTYNGNNNKPSTSYKAPSSGSDYQIRYGPNGKPCKVTNYGTKSKGASKPMKKSKAKTNSTKDETVKAE